ncbi:hypothetical protein N643_03475 [Salmonella bongori serovar 48:z41:-- str. RKS3044]|nr:hypothetical protein N643_03475 [Salmonella bongori serovar 48:z41:-- str. RKS3044]
MDNCFQPVCPAAWQNQRRAFSWGDKKKLSRFLDDYRLARREKIAAYTLIMCLFFIATLKYLATR